MCSVSGLVAFSKPGNQAKDIEVVFREIFTRAADRGIREDQERLHTR